MALINCPECKTEVSDKADKCPKCAYPINTVITEPSPEKQEIVVQSNEGCFLETLNLGCMAIVILFAVFAVLFFIFAIKSS